MVVDPSSITNPMLTLGAFSTAPTVLSPPFHRIWITKSPVCFSQLEPDRVDVGIYSYCHFDLLLIQCDWWSDHSSALTLFQLLHQIISLRSNNLICFQLYNKILSFFNLKQLTLNNFSQYFKFTSKFDINSSLTLLF